MNRTLQFEGCFNARDLGGLRLLDGRLTRFGAFVRSDDIQRFTAADWQKLADYGIRTIIDLRNPDERGQDLSLRPSSFETIHIPLDVREDQEFWSHWKAEGKWGTPLYFRAHLERFPQRHAAVVRAAAQARNQGVLFHCQVGRDRTGLIAIVLLHLAGVLAEDIVLDHSLSQENISRLYAFHGKPDDKTKIELLLAKHGTTARQLITELLTGLDVEDLLLQSEFSASDISVIRQRLSE